MNLQLRIQQLFHQALAGMVPDPTPYSTMVRAAQDPKFGDYQANCAMSLAKVLGKPPRVVAQDIVQRLDCGEMLDKPEIAGPGFINLRLNSAWLAKELQRNARGDRLGVEPAQPAKTIVIDFSSPNVAKPMHVGHLRSTIIGDALTRLYRFLGHRVITDNHLGDWGTQFGIILYGYKHFRDEAALKADFVREMTRLYIHVRNLMKDEDVENANNPIAEAARQETAKLHAGDPENLRLWQSFMPWCRQEIDAVYERLDVHFDHTLGESFYNPMLAEVVKSLLEKAIAQESEGAVAIFFGENDTPALVRKKDGAFTYTTTDLATIRYRVETWNPDAILYLVDARQALHFQHLFDAARRWGYDRVQLEHVAFGSVLAPDRKPIKTREGGAIELTALLDEAIQHGANRYDRTRQERVERGEEVPEISPEEKRQIAEIVGLGAVKYADLSQNRTSDYIFSWEKMLAMDGNTATYMQYAYARNRSIFRRGGDDPQTFRTAPPLPTLEHPHERALGRELIRFEEALAAAAVDHKPSAITSYLWDLAKSYSGFFENCPVLKAESPELRRSRLLMCDLTARTIQKALELLGIRTVEQI